VEITEYGHLLSHTMTGEWEKLINDEGIGGNINGMMKEVTDGGGREWGMENYSIERIRGGWVYIEGRWWGR
jgi:hypothetical protein